MIVYKEKIAQKNLQLKIDLSTLVTTSLSNISFHLLPIWLQTLVAIDSELYQSHQTSFPRICVPPPEVSVLFYLNLSRRPFLIQVAFHLLPIWLQTLVAIDSESRLTSFPSFCAPLSEVAALFDSNLSRRPFLRQVVDLDLLLCTGFDLEHAVLFLCHIFTQRPMNDCKIERSRRRCFGQQQLLADSIEIFIKHEKKVARRGPISTKHLNLFDCQTKSVSQEW